MGKDTDSIIKQSKI